VCATTARPSTAAASQIRSPRMRPATNGATPPRPSPITRATSVTLTGASSTDFNQGWTITEAAGGTTLRTQGSRVGKITFTGNANVYTFDKTGRVTVGAPAQWAIAPTESGAQDYMKRCVKLDPSGRPRTNEGVCS